MFLLRYICVIILLRVQYALASDNYATYAHLSPAYDVTARGHVYKETLKEHLQHLSEGKPHCQNKRHVRDELLIRHFLTNQVATCNDGTIAG